MENIQSLSQLKKEYIKINSQIEDLDSKMHALNIRRWIIKKEMKKTCPEDLSSDSSSSDS